MAATARLAVVASALRLGLGITAGRPRSKARLLCVCNCEKNNYVSGYCVRYNYHPFLLYIYMFMYVPQIN